MSVQERAGRQLEIFPDMKPLTFRLHGKAHSNKHTHTHQRNFTEIVNVVKLHGP